MPACWLVFSFVAHYPATPAPWYETRFPDVTIPITPNYNISSPNKTQHIRQNPPLTDGAPPQPRSQPDSCLAFQTSALCQASLHFSPCKDVSLQQGDRFELLNIHYKYIIHYTLCDGVCDAMHTMQLRNVGRISISAIAGVLYCLLMSLLVTSLRHSRRRT